MQIHALVNYFYCLVRRVIVSSIYNFFKELFTYALNNGVVICFPCGYGF